MEGRQGGGQAGGRAGRRAGRRAGKQEGNLVGNGDGTWPRPPNDQPASCSLKWNLIGFWFYKSFSQSLSLAVAPLDVCITQLYVCVNMCVHVDVYLKAGRRAGRGAFRAWPKGCRIAVAGVWRSSLPFCTRHKYAISVSVRYVCYSPARSWLRLRLRLRLRWSRISRAESRAAATADWRTSMPSETTFDLQVPSGNVQLAYCNKHQSKCKFFRNFDSAQIRSKPRVAREVWRILITSVSVCSPLFISFNMFHISMKISTLMLL